MKDYQRLKPILESKNFFCKVAKGPGSSEAPVASRSSPPSKPSVKHRLDLLPSSDNGGEAHKKPRNRGKKSKNPTPRQVCSPIPPPIRRQGGVTIQEGSTTPRRID